MEETYFEENDVSGVCFSEEECELVGRCGMVSAVGVMVASDVPPRCTSTVDFLTICGSSAWNFFNSLSPHQPIDSIGDARGAYIGRRSASASCSVSSVIHETCRSSR